MKIHGMWRPLLMLLVMAGAIVAAIATRPERAPPNPNSFRLDSSVPEHFADWRIDNSDTPILPSPELQAVIDKTYEQTLDRTYVDSKGRRIMLALALSTNYDKGMQWHRPENCYPSQGFTIDEKTTPVEINTARGTVDAVQLVARRGQRIEPITYWFVLGDKQTRFGVGLRLRQVLYGLGGRIPNGLIVRISSIGNEIPLQYDAQQDFARDLLASLAGADLGRFLGANAIAPGASAGG